MPDPAEDAPPRAAPTWLGLTFLDYEMDLKSPLPGPLPGWFRSEAQVHPAANGDPVAPGGGKELYLPYVQAPW